MAVRKLIVNFSLLGLIILLIALVVRTVNLSHSAHPVKECKPTDADFIPLSKERLKHFQEAIRFQTVSWDIGKYDTGELQRFGDYIIKNFPNIHKKSPHVEWERVNSYSLLYYIKGSNPDLKPYLLMSHLDVVPATEENTWDAPPFSGDVVNGFIYGRGTIDVKQSAMGILEATEYMLEHNSQPHRSFYIAFGHDEEVHGKDGAGSISQRLLEKGVTEFEFVHDEGMVISDGVITGVKRPVAGIAVTEKGQAVLKLSVTSSSGHSSMPPKESTIGILSRAVSRLETTPYPSMLGSGVETDMLEHLAPEMGVLQRFVIANIWFFKSVLSFVMSADPVSNALIRTVTSITIFNAGIKSNVVPPYAQAIVNHRIHPSQSIKEIIEYDRSIIADDRVKIELVSGIEPHPLAGSSESDFGYQVLKTSIRQVWTDVVVVPTLLVGNTDTRFYLNFTQNVYRFSPTYMFKGDHQRFHGKNERIGVKNYEQAINFFYHIIRNSDQKDVSPVHHSHSDL